MIEKSQNFLENFQNFLHFWSKRATFGRQLSYVSLADGNHSSNLDDLSVFYKFQSIFSKNFKNYHPISNSPSRTKPVLGFYWEISQVDNKIHRKFLWIFKNFSGNITLHKTWQIEILKISFWKNSEISNFFRKRNFSDKKNVDIFELF